MSRLRQGAADEFLQAGIEPDQINRLRTLNASDIKRLAALPHTMIGLSNVSQGTKFRPLINRTFLTMAIANGLTSAILDPLDKELMDAMITAELILNKAIYCDSFLEAYRKR